MIDKQLEKRLSKLERSNTHLRAILVFALALPLVALVQSQDNQNKPVEKLVARNFIVVDKTGKELGRLGTVAPIYRKRGAVFQSQDGDTMCILDASGLMLTTEKPASSLTIIQPGQVSTTTSSKEEGTSEIHLRTGPGRSAINIGRNNGEILSVLEDSKGARVITGKHSWPPR